MLKRPLQSLQGRLLALVLGVVGTLWVAAGLLSVRDAHHELDELLDGHLAQAAALLIAQQGHPGEDDGDEDTVADDAPVLHRYAPRVAFQVWHEGRLVLHSANAPAEPLAPMADGPAGLGFSTQQHGGAPWRVFAAQGGERDILAFVGERMDARDSILAAVIRGLAGPLLVGLPLLALSAWLAVRGGLAPLRRLATALQQREPDATSPIALPAPPRELQAVTAALNALFARIGRLLDSERRLTADAAHELRTPIAAIAAQAQVALAADDDGTRRHALEGLRAGCDRAARLVEQMLTLARLEQGGAPPPQPVDLPVLARRIIGDALPLAQAKGQSVELEAPGHGVVHTDETLLGVLLRNLVDNALRYAPAGAQVLVSLQVPATGAWRLSVEDSGPGMSDAELAHLGERFFRVPGNDAPGSGLGWSIVRRIAQVLALEVRAGRAPSLGGLAVTLGPAGTVPS